MKKGLTKVTALLVAFLMVFAFGGEALACTGFIVGSDLTKDGSTIFGRTEDLEINHNKVFKVHKEGTYPAGKVITDVSYMEKGGYSFKMPHASYKYTSVSDTTPEYGYFDEAGFNEKGLMADMTVSATARDEILKHDPYLDEGLAEAIITTVVLTTADNALNGIKLVAKEVASKGAAEGNGFVLADSKELWYMEIYSGHQFLAMKYPTDKFSVFPNTFWINEVKLEKGEEKDGYIVSKDGNYIYSKGLFETAKKAGTLKGSEKTGKIDLFESYAPQPMRPSNISRVTSGILAMNPKAEVCVKDGKYPFLQDAPEKSIDVKTAMDFTRNRLENLRLEANDLGKGGLYPIGNRNTMESHIFQVPQGAAATNPGIMWLTLGSPLVQPYVPYYPNQTKGIDKVMNETNDPDLENSHYWLAMDTLHKVERNRHAIMDLIKPSIDKLEKEMIAKAPFAPTNPDEVNAKYAKMSFDLLKENNKIANDNVNIAGRIGGQNRIETAIEVSKKNFDYSKNVVVARADDFPDALSASAFAKALKAPILLVNGKKVDESGTVQSEIKRLGAKTVYVIGKESAITKEVAESLKPRKGKVERIGGENRFETSAMIANKLVEIVGNKGYAVFATGNQFADSLSVSSFAAAKGYPILLTGKDKVDSSVKKAIKDLDIKSSYIVGGTSAVSEEVAKELPKLVKRLGGENRFETSAAIARELLTTAKKAFVASGQNFADALVIGPVAAMEGAPILLVQKDALPAAIKTEVARAAYEKTVVVGLESAVSKDVETALKTK